MSKRRVQGAALILLLLLAAFMARSLNHRQVFTSSGVLYFGVDPYYHVRRSLLTALHFPQVPRFDYYSGYPRGMESHFAPLWDLLSAGAGRLQAVLSPAGAEERVVRITQVVRLWSALLPALLGALSVVLVFQIGRLLTGRNLLALLGGLLLALSPAHLDYTILGRPDHHVLESLLTTLAVLFYLQLLMRPEKRHGFLPLGLALTLAACFLSSAQCLLFAGLLALHALGLGWPRSGADPELSRVALRVFAWTATLLTAGTALILPSHLLRLHYDRPSLYQPLVLLMMMGALWLEGIWNQRSAATGIRRLLLPAGVIFWLVLGMLLLRPTLSGLGFIGRSPQWIPDIQDAYPLFFVGGRLNPGWVAGQLGLVGMLAPFWMMAVLFLRGRPNAARTFVLFWAGATLILTLYQVRFIYFLAAALSCLFVLILDQTCARLEVSPVFSRRLKTLGAASWVFTALLQSPTFSVLAARTQLSSLDPDVLDACLWLKEYTPRTRFLHQPTRQPEYGVLSQWDLGNFIILLAERPAIATASHQANLEGIRESIRFFLSHTEQEAVSVLERNRVRYVLMESSVGDFDVQARLVGKDDGPYSIREVMEGQLVFRITDRYRQSFYGQLHLFDGRGQGNIPPLQHFRLVYESPRREAGFMGVHHVKIFEFVPGARLEGYGTAGREIRVVARVRTNQGRIFNYEQRVSVSGRGTFHLRVPYSSDAPAGHAVLDGPLLLQRQTGPVEAYQVPEAAVVTGRTIFLSPELPPDWAPP